MSNTSFSTPSDTFSVGALPADGIINDDHVKWAARRFILIYGDEAPEVASNHVRQLDARGKLRTAEMFARVQEECARLLKKSEMLRKFTVN